MTMHAHRLPVRPVRNLRRQETRPTAGSPLARLYALYAAASLVTTLLSGTWLRAAFVFPDVLGGFTFRNTLHAHSHLAFYGWTTLALFSLISYRAQPERSAPWLRWHAHAAGLASAAAFIGFLNGGYNTWTIALSVVHVMLWVIFVSEVWVPIGRLPAVERTLLRGAIGFLLIAGAGAMTPGLLMMRGVENPWLGQLALHSFLTPFMAGWLVLGAMGAAYRLMPDARFPVAAFRLMLLGVLPSALLHPSAPPPAEWLLLVGRGGTLLVGAGTLLFAVDLLGSRRGADVLLMVAGVAALLKGAAEVGLSLVAAHDLLHLRSLEIAYLHLVLLGFVTPILIATALRLRRHGISVALYAGGLVTMLAALVMVGLPQFLAALTSVGLSPPVLYQAAFAGGAACAAGVLLMLTSKAVQSFGGSSL